MEIRLIASDIDGTLVNDRGEITALTAYVLRQAQAMGIPVAICTGRTRGTMGMVLSALDPPDYLIQSNGASIWEEKSQSVIYRNLMGWELFQEALPIVSQSDLGWHCFIDGVCYADSRFAESYRDFFLKSLGRRDFFNFRPVENLAQWILNTKPELEKMAVLTPNQPLRAKIMEELKATGKFSVSSASYFNIELNPAGVDKGTALKALAQYLNIPMEQVAAFGDNLNDLPMLSAAGVSVAMENGLPEAKKTARYQAATNNDHGVARFLAQNLHINIDPYL